MLFVDTFSGGIDPRTLSNSEPFATSMMTSVDGLQERSGVGGRGVEFLWL